jgi:HKD family nuclease
MTMKKKKPIHKKKGRLLLIVFMVLVITVMVYHRIKPLPSDTSFAGEVHTVSDENVEFLYDLTYQQDGKENYDQSIFKEVYKTIKEADEFLILDLFLVNAYSNGERKYPPISSKLRKTIENKMKENPKLKVVFITDEINTTYNSHRAEQIEPLKKLGAEVIFTDLNQLRDPNILYSGIWRTALSWFGQEGTGWLPNPLADHAPAVTLRSYFKLLNIKANHRKVVITEDAGLILSANPHDASGFHSNIAFKIKGRILQDMIKTEKAAAAFSGSDLKKFPNEKELEKIGNSAPQEKLEASIKAQILTESKIQDSVVEAIDNAEKENIIWVGMFYLADRNIIDALEDAAERGIDVRLILDPNQNAFGSEKMGLPNIPVAAELYKTRTEHLTVRWYNTNKEQYHTKLIYIKGKKESTIIGGSANYTSRNLDDYNLETNIKLQAPSTSKLVQNVNQYFERIWNNKNGSYTLHYETYENSLPVFKYLMYILQKIFQFTTY